MEKTRIAIVGLGRVGGTFFDALTAKENKAVEIVALAEIGNPPAREKVESLGYRVGTIPDVVKLGEDVDIVFDLTGNSEVRRELRESYAATSNRHTAIVPEVVARLIISLNADTPLPDVHDLKGY